MFISVDVGGTNTRIAASNDLGNLEFNHTVSRRINSHNYEEDIGFIVREALELARGEQISGLGIGVAVVLNEDRTKIVHGENLPSWVGKPIVEHLFNGLGCPIYMENDAVAMGYGEAFYGKTQGDFDFIIWGTGIGGAEIRHWGLKVRVQEKAWPVYFKSWEMQDGGKRLAIEYGKPTTAFSKEDWGMVAQRFKQNIVRYCQEHNPTSLVFGGGLATHHSEMLLSMAPDIGVPIAVSRFGNDSGLVGGFGLIRQGQVL